MAKPKTKGEKVIMWALRIFFSLLMLSVIILKIPSLIYGSIGVVAELLGYLLAFVLLYKVGFVFLRFIKNIFFKNKQGATQNA